MIEWNARPVAVATIIQQTREEKKETIRRLNSVIYPNQEWKRDGSNKIIELMVAWKFDRNKSGKERERADGENC